MSLFKISYKEKSIHIIQEFSGKKCKTIVHSVPTFDQINFWNQAVIAFTKKVLDFLDPYGIRFHIPLDLGHSKKIGNLFS